MVNRPEIMLFPLPVELRVLVPESVVAPSDVFRNRAWCLSTVSPGGQGVVYLTNFTSPTAMTNPTSLVLATHLLTLGIFTDPVDEEAFPLYVGFLPDGGGVPDNAGAIYDTTGVKDGRLMSGSNVLHDGIQVKVRSKGYLIGWKKINEVTVLDAVDQRITTVTINGFEYEIANVSQVSTVLSLGIEEGTKRRNLFTLNFLVTLKEV